MKPAKYSIKIFAVIDVTALFTEHVQQYQACAAVLSMCSSTEHVQQY